MRSKLGKCTVEYPMRGCPGPRLDGLVRRPRPVSVFASSCPFQSLGLTTLGNDFPQPLVVGLRHSMGRMG